MRRSARGALPVFALGCALLAALACAGPPPGELAPCPAAPDPALVASLGEKVAVAGGDAGRGAELFARLCVRCHAPEAAARDSRLFRAYPRLDCASYLSRTSPGYLYTVIAEGGPAVGRGERMKGLGAELAAREIADLVAHLTRAGAR